MESVHNYAVNILITGAAGQDGSFLVDLHIKKGDKVWGTVSSDNKASSKINFEPIYSKLEDEGTAISVLNRIVPDRIYHMAAVHSSSTTKFPMTKEIREKMFACHVSTTKNILEWQVHNSSCRLVVALSSQMYSPVGNITKVSENSQVNPSNYYGETKVQAMNLLRQYREKYDLKTYGAILFNHTSLRSKSSFLFPHLARELAALARGENKEIYLDDASALIDITHAYEVCNGLYQLINTREPQEIIFSSGELFKISEVISKAASRLNLNPNVAIESKTKDDLTRKYVVGNNSLAWEKLGWKPIMKPEDILYEQVSKELKI